MMRPPGVKQHKARPRLPTLGLLHNFRHLAEIEFDDAHAGVEAAYRPIPKGHVRLRFRDANRPARNRSSWATVLGELRFLGVVSPAANHVQG